MVDTIYLQTENFSVNQFQKFATIKSDHLRPNANLFLGYLTPDKTQPVFGIHALAIQTGRTDHRSTVHFEITTRDNRKFLTIKISSLPRLLYAHNLFPFDEPEEFRNAIKLVKSYADGFGISILSWDELLVTRIDLSYAMQTRERVSKYIALISEIQAKGYNQVVYPSGIEFRAKNRVYSFYDKYDQMKNVYEKLGKEYFPILPPPGFPDFSTEELRSHILRIELKFKGMGSIKNRFKTKLHWGDIEQSIQLLRQIFHTEVNKFISRIDTRDLEPSFGNDSDGAAGHPGQKSEILTAQHSLEALMESFIRKYAAENKGNWYPSLMKIIGEHYANLILESKFMSLIQEIVLNNSSSNTSHTSRIQQISRIKTAYARHRDAHFPELVSSRPAPERLDLKNELVQQLRFYSYEVYTGPLNINEPGKQHIEFKYATFLSGGELDAWVNAELKQILENDVTGTMNLTDDSSSDQAEVLNSFATSDDDSPMQRPTILKNSIFLVKNQFPTRVKLPISFVSA